MASRYNVQYKTGLYTGYNMQSGLFYCYSNINTISVIVTSLWCHVFEKNIMLWFIIIYIIQSLIQYELRCLSYRCYIYSGYYRIFAAP